MVQILKKGRPKTKDDPELSARNVEIYQRRFVEKISIPELAKEYNLSRKQIERCLKFVGDEIGSVPGKVALEGSIFNLESRLRDLIKLRTTEIKRKNPSVRSVCEINKEVRCDEEVLLKLSGLLKNVIQIESTEDVGVKDIVKVLADIEEAGNVPKDKVVDVAIGVLTSKKN